MPTFRGENGWKARWPLVFYAAILLGSIVAYSSSAGSGRFLVVFSVMFVAALASSTTGALLGFIFGLPRRAGEQIAEEASGELGGVAQGSRVARTDQDVIASAGRYVTNTSLGQVSDWLTKILIGAGLVQLADVPRALRAVSDFIAGALPEAGASVFAVGLIVFSLTSGFILTFLWTSLIGRELYESIEEKIARGSVYLQTRVRSLRDIGPERPEESFQRTAPAQLPEPDIRQVENLAAAVKTFTDKYRTEPLSAGDYRRLARQLRAAGHLEEAYDMYLHAYRADPNDPAPLNFAGAIASAHLGRHEEADKLYRQALAINPDYASARYNRACNAARRGDIDTALYELQEAIKRNPERYKSLAIQDSRPPDGPFQRLSDDARFIKLTRGEREDDQATTGTGHKVTAR